MALCQKCGREVGWGAQYCPSCGTAVQGVVQQTPGYFPTYPSKPKNERGLILVLVSVVVIVLVIGGAVAASFVSSIASQPNISITNAQVAQPQGRYDSSGNCLGEIITFSFVLVNSGGSNGYAHIVFSDNQTQLWANNYLVAEGSLFLSAI